MQIVTWNMLSDDYIDFKDPSFIRKYYREIPTNDLKIRKRLPILLKTIASQKADVYCLQEVMTKTHEALLLRFSADYHIGPLVKHRFKRNESNYNRTGNCIMIRKRFGSALFASFRLRDDQLWPHFEYYSVAVATTPTFLIYSVHFADDSTKFAQARDFVNRVEFNQQRHPEKQVIIGGDFNTSSHKMHNMFSGFFRISQQHPNGTYLCNKNQIDYIYSSRSTREKPVICRSPAPCDYQNVVKEFGSDHVPVLARC